ncbi:MAG: hypothetical protein A2Y09_08235 [Planctomycetes bacterium GWA2_39_15]|nr:MAG: hypothetical protein A2Y09_08235 [Planctomycetes bacterium GWA2_39_15]
MKIKHLISERAKPTLRKILQHIWLKSLERAIKEQRLKELAVKLKQIVPDITEQYSNFLVNTSFLNLKVIGLHAFQMSLVGDAISNIKNPVIVDIGDSAGTHLQYIVGLYSDNKNISCLSVNLDSKAVEKIINKGFNAVHARAEDLHKYNINADIFLCFETLEHLMNPCTFLHDLSTKTNAQFLVITVPYLKDSRVGLHHIRNNITEAVNAEKTHIFELNPDDWKLIVRHSGWDIVEEAVYLQYPKKGIMRITKYLWKKYDFEGFYGLILKRDSTYASRYLNW